MRTVKGTDVRILLVEDEPAQASLIERLFSHSEDGDGDTTTRYRLECASSLSEAMKRISEEEFDLVLLDLLLPDSRGLATFQKLRGGAPDIPVVILTNCTEEDNATKALQAGAQDYISKADISRGILRRSVRYAIERNKLQQSVRALSIRDELTGLYNRRGFIALASQQIRVERRLKSGITLIFADVDNMKQINDTLGHEDGDRALAEVARILKEIFRESDVIARIAGDEFAILAMGTSESEPDRLIERLHARLKARNARRDLRFRLLMSAGAMRCEPGKPSSVAEMLRGADAAMYSAKNKRKERRAGAGTIPRPRAKRAPCRNRPKSS